MRPRLHVSPHPDVCLLAQPGEALVWVHHPTSDPARQIFKRQGADRQNRALHRQLQQVLSTFQLDCDCRFNCGDRRSSSAFTLYFMGRDTRSLFNMPLERKVERLTSSANLDISRGNNIIQPKQDFAIKTSETSKKLRIMLRI